MSENQQNPAAADYASEAESGLPSELTDPADATFVTTAASRGGNTGLVVVMLVALSAAGIYFMRAKAGPSMAAAATPETATAKATINAFLTDGGKNIRAMQDLLKNTEKVVQQFATYPLVTQVGVDDLKTNPFCFERKKPTTPGPDLDRLRQKEKEEIVRAVQQMKLQSVLHSGAVRTCMINNQTWTEGQEFDGFRVEQILPNSVVVRKAGYRFELRMQR